MPSMKPQKVLQDNKKREIDLQKIDFFCDVIPVMKNHYLHG